MTKRHCTSIGTALGLVALFAAGLGMRRAVLLAQFAAFGRDLPFTLESALNFRRIEQVYADGRLTAVDRDIQYPDGVVVREADTVGSEYVQAALARLFPASVPLADRIRWIEASWFCLGIPLMALWLWWWKRSLWGSAVAAGFYAVALSSVMRSTGQEISHENFALPLLIGHFAFGALSSASGRRPAGWGAALVSSLLLAAALVTWDLVQFYVLVWSVALVARVVRGRDGAWDASKGVVPWVVLVATGVVNPYLRAHGFLVSPAMLLSYGALIAFAVKRAAASGRCRPAWGRPFALAGFALLPLMVIWLVPNPYGQSYGHFTDLLAAKVRFLNHKPWDPSRLTFDQRIMWVPALHSANWALTGMLFPVMLWLSLAAIPVLIRRSSNHSDPCLNQLLLLYVASLAAFVLFVRFHVYLAMASAGLLGGWAASAAARDGWKRWVVLGALVAGMTAEAVHVLRRPDQWGRTLVYYKEMGELVDWLRGNAESRPVLANFGVSASILTYGKCPIVLHPKFESRAIRERVRAYGEALFKGTEKDLRDWADDHGARYYVYALGEFSDVAPGQQMRYFVNALNPPEDCPARMFEYAPETGTYFGYLWGNHKYRVFKIRTRADEALARRHAGEARAALERGDLDRAEERAVAALLLNPSDETAQDVVRHAGSLRDQGFRNSGHEPQ